MCVCLCVCLLYVIGRRRVSSGSVINEYTYSSPGNHGDTKDSADYKLYMYSYIYKQYSIGTHVFEMRILAKTYHIDDRTDRIKM